MNLIKKKRSNRKISRNDALFKTQFVELLETIRKNHLDGLFNLDFPPDNLQLSETTKKFIFIRTCKDNNCFGFLKPTSSDFNIPEKTDVYNLGIFLHFHLCREYPIYSPDHNIMFLNCDTPTDYVFLISSMLNLDQNERPSVLQLLKKL